jgi:deoxyribodipyrimidine photo-lyase
MEERILHRGRTIGHRLAEGRASGASRRSHAGPRRTAAQGIHRRITADRQTARMAEALQIVWFKRDLRAHDHAPLALAARAGPVLPLYIVEPALWRQPDASARQYAFHAECVADLQDALAAHGVPLLLRVGEATDVFAALLRGRRIGAVWSHMETGNAWTFARDRAVAALLRARGVPWHEPRAFGVLRGLRLRQGWAGQWERFVREPAPPIAALRAAAVAHAPQRLPSAAELGLAPDPCPQRQRGGRGEAQRLLEGFVEPGGRGARYHRLMSSPRTAARACSRLSPHLAAGSIGLREVVSAVRAARDGLAGSSSPGAAVQRRALVAYESRLHWHCHFIQKLETEPAIEHACVHPGYADLRPATADPVRLAAWAAGATGWPLVDACMRMLDATGWVNFRMRAMLVAVASWHLWLPWQDSGRVLARRFTDYEPGIHWPQVQMQSGTTGINIPRIYNPVKQSRDQDPDGAFIRRWVPELARVPAAWVHEPWRMPDALQRARGCRIGTDYPAPLVDHEQAAREARARLTEWRRHPGMAEQGRVVLARHGSRRRRIVPAAPPPPQADLFGPPA